MAHPGCTARSDQVRGDPSVSDLDALKQALAAHAHTLAQELLPEGRRQGREWYASGSRSPLGEAVSVVTSGAKAGTVLFCVTGKGGSLLDLLMEVHGLSFGEACEEARRLLGWPAREVSRRPDPAARKAAEDARRAREAAQHQNEADRLRYALSIWEGSGPMTYRDQKTVDGPAARYLVGRGIKCPPGGWPPSLRCRSGLPHPDGLRWLALVARLQDKHGTFRGVWRIYLDRHGLDVTKAPVSTPKLGLGVAKGAYVPLSEPSARVALCEGIETGFGVMALTQGRRAVYACLSTAGLVNVDLPDEARDVAIYADADDYRERNGKIHAPPGCVSAEKAAERLRAEGRKVSVMVPTRGRDWLDEWLALGVA